MKPDAPSFVDVKQNYIIQKKNWLILFSSKNLVNVTGGGATITGPDATYPPAICQNSGGGGAVGGGGVQPGVGGSSRGSRGGGSSRGSGGSPAGGLGGGSGRGSGGRRMG